MVGQGQHTVCKLEVNHADIQWHTAMASAVFSGPLLAVRNSQLAFWPYRRVHVHLQVFMYLPHCQKGLHCLSYTLHAEMPLFTWD